FVWSTSRHGCAARSAECERVSFHAQVDELDLKQPIGNGLGLSDQLIQSLFGDRSVALIVDIGPVSSTRRPSIKEHAKPHGSPSRCRSHDEMQIAGVEAIYDPPVGLVQHAGLPLDAPIA